ncbi:hypothetical protein [uncultured Brevundimonas sp.]|uniref:hypothetical protein n=1 Tax=uncultured Brevundimonas sp. TaxID=213418 RepID=UPI00261A2C70|nr:hypothetical protein [uncultured Brevundimonas sp.]
MSETTYTGQPGPEDIDDGVELESARLDREADAILLGDEARTPGPRPLHTAVREDALAARDWGRARAERLRRAVEEGPMQATLYALGLGVVIGLLIAR